MLLDQLLFGVLVFSVFFLFLTLVFLIKNRQYERSQFEQSINSLVFGLFFLLLSMLVQLLNAINETFKGSLAKMIPDINTYLDYLLTISDVALVPLFAVCFFVGIYLAKENFSS